MKTLNKINDLLDQVNKGPLNLELGQVSTDKIINNISSISKEYKEAGSDTLVHIIRDQQGITLGFYNIDEDDQEIDTNDYVYYIDINNEEV